MVLPALLLALFADLIYLKDGRVWNGEVVEEETERVRIKLPRGAVWVARSDIDRIESEADLKAEYARRATAAKTAEAHRELARWCAGTGLAAEERREWEALVALSPDDAEARRILGHVKVEGTWMTEAEAAKARGLVERDGEWVTPQRAQVLDLLPGLVAEDLVARGKARRALQDLGEAGLADVMAVADAAEKELSAALAREPAVLTALGERARAIRGPLVSLVADEQRFPSKDPPAESIRRMRDAVDGLARLAADPAGEYVAMTPALARHSLRLAAASRFLEIDDRFEALCTAFSAKAGAEAVFRHVDAWKGLRAKVTEENASVEMSGPERGLLDAVNTWRLRCGRGPLRWDLKLEACARQHTDEMHEKEYFSHRSPVAKYETLAKRSGLAGFKSKWVGENLALGDDPPEVILKAFQDSPGHHRNLLFAEYTRVGIAKTGEYWTVNFGGDPE